MSSVRESFGEEPSEKSCNLEELAKTRGVDWIYANPKTLSNLTNDWEGLREFLTTERERRRLPTYSTRYGVLVTLYDWLRWGRAAA